MDATPPPRDDHQPTPAEPAVERVSDGGPEDPTVPDTAVEATLTTEPAGTGPEEPVVPTGHPDEVRVATPPVDDAPTRESAVSPAEAPAPAEAPPAPEQATTAPGPEIVYVAAPAPPKKKGNRAVGALIAALSTILFLLVYIAVVVLINTVQGRGSGTDFLQRIEFYIPVLLFAIGFTLLAVLVNRAGWWSFVLGSFFVGAFVYLGTVGVLLLSQAASLTLDTAAVAFRSLLISPIVVAAGLVAREVSLWAGAGISARGRRVTARNEEARARFEHEQAEHRAEIDRAGAVVRPA